MIINERQFYDYMECPTKYELKHIHNLQIDEPKSVTRLLQPVVNYFFMSIFNSKIPSVESLKSRWDKICEENVDYIDPKKNIRGIGTIINLYKYAQNNKLAVIDIGSPYTITTDNNNKMIGNLSNPIVTSNGHLELFVPYLSNKYPKDIELSTKLKFTIESRGFEEANNERLSGIHILMVNKLKEYETTRNYMDYERLNYAIDGVCKGIENEVFYPRESAFCDSCNARAFCRYWKGK